MADYLPTTDSSRARLRAAQKAEATALRKVEAADRIRRRAQQSLDKAQELLDAAQVELVEVSGPDRAALLLDLPVETLHRVVNHGRRRPPANRPPGAGGSAAAARVIVP